MPTKYDTNGLATVSKKDIQQVKASFGLRYFLAEGFGGEDAEWKLGEGETDLRSTKLRQQQVFKQIFPEMFPFFLKYFQKASSQSTSKTYVQDKYVQKVNRYFLEIFTPFCFLFSVFCWLFSVFRFLLSVFCFLISVFCLKTCCCLSWVLRWIRVSH